MKIYTKKEAAEELKISVRTLERLLASGELRAYKVAGQIRISDDQISDYLAHSMLLSFVIQKAAAAGSGGGVRRLKKQQRIEYVPGMKVV